MDTATTTTSTLLGRTLAGRFRITGFIGEGAMATVYRGVQEAEPHDVAIKVMHPHLIGEPSFVKRFRREAKAASMLKHPGSVQIIDYGIDAEMPYIAMELLAGQDLFEILLVEKALHQALAVRILIQVTDALAAAHELGIVHRDLKPENVMLLRDPNDPSQEVVKVLDFGIAKIVDRNDKDPDEPPPSIADSVLTTVGVIVGTPQYMSPEQCRAGPIDARSDVYACGILLYQLVTGKLPFTGEHPFEIAMKQVREQPPPPSSILPTIHPELEKVILTALEKWPAQRQQNARELRDELIRVLRLLPDDRPVRVSWPAAPDPSTAYARRSLGITSPISGPSTAPNLRTTSEPSTMRSPNGSWSDRPPAPDPWVPVETITARDQSSSSPGPAPYPPPRRTNTPLAATLAEGSMLNPVGGAVNVPVVPSPPRPAAPPPHAMQPVNWQHPQQMQQMQQMQQQPGALARPHAPRKSSGLAWLLLPMAIGVGIGVGILAYLIMHFTMR